MCDSGLKEHMPPMITLAFTGQAYWPRHWLLLFLLVLLTTNASDQSPAETPTGSGGISVETVTNTACPPEDEIAPCRCMIRAEELQLWCSHSDLATVQAALRAVSRAAPARLIDELILENNALGAGVLGAGPGAGPAVARLMLRDNGLERVPAGWLAGLEHSLVELFVVEPLLRGLPDDSLLPFRRLEALTLQCGAMQSLPRLSGLPRLRYLFVRSPVLWQVPFDHLRALPALEQLHVVESPRLTTLDAGVLSDLPRLAVFNVTSCGLSWLHQRSLQRLPALSSILLTGNRLADAAALGRALRGLPSLAQLRLEDNALEQLPEGAFAQLPALRDVSLAGNRVTEVHRGALSTLPALRSVDMSRNQLRMLHPDAFQNTPLLEELWLQDNALDSGATLAALLTALPRLRFLDLSRNRVGEIGREDVTPHNSLERLHLDGNRLRRVFRGALSGLPALRELRLADNLLTNNLDLPFWNLPALKGLDLARNQFRRCDNRLLAHLPSLRRLDLSDNTISVVDPGAFLGSPALEHVNLSGNALAALTPGTFGALRGLFELDVGRNRLVNFVPGLPPGLEYLRMPMNQVTALPPAGSPDLQLPALRLLDLSANGLRSLQPDGLRQLRGLQQLLIAGNALSELPAGALSGLPRLERLDLKSNRLSELGPHSLAGLRSLRKLDMRDNKLEQLPSAVLGDAPALEELDVSSNQLAELHPDALRENRMLRALRASHNALSDLPEALKRAPALRVLDISANRLAVLPPGAFSGMPALQELHLSRNRLRELPQGALEKLPGLKHLDISDNMLQGLGPKALNALPALEQLVLAHNRIASLAPGALTDTPVLAAAQFQHNALRDVKPGALAGAPSLQLLNLSYNQLGALDAAGLAGLRRLEVLDLSHNRVARLQAPPASLDGLVELKMDHNLLCTVSTLPFSRMARLKVLSLSDNRVRSLPDDAVMRLRANDGRVEVAGNPLWCSCEALQLHSWLTEAPMAGDAPRCSDGSPLRELRVSRQDCGLGGSGGGAAGLRAAAPPPPQGCEADGAEPSLSPERNTVGGTGSTSQVISAALEVHNSPQSTPLKNQVTPVLPTAAAGAPGPGPAAPSPEDSEYFYEDYVEYNPALDNATGAVNLTNQKTSPNSLGSTQGLSETPSHQGTVTSMTVTSGPVDLVSSHYIPGDTPTVYAGTRKPTTPMTTPRPPPPPPPPPGGLMFFGIPLKMPSLSFFGAGRGADGRSAPKDGANGESAGATASNSPEGTPVSPPTFAITENPLSISAGTTIDVGTNGSKTTREGALATGQRAAQTSPAGATTSDLGNKVRVVSDIFHRTTPNAGTTGNAVSAPGFTSTGGSAVNVATAAPPSTAGQPSVTGTVVRVTPTTAGGFTPILPGGGVFRHDSPSPGPPTFGGPIVVTESYNIKDGHEESVRLHSSSEEAVHVRTSYRRPSGSTDEDNLVEVLALTPRPPSGSVDVEQAIVYNLGESAPTTAVLPAQQVSTLLPSTEGTGSTVPKEYTGAMWTKAVTGVVGVSGPTRTTGTDSGGASSMTTSPAGITAADSIWTTGTNGAGTTGSVGSTWAGTSADATGSTEGTTVLATSTRRPTGATNSWSTGFTGARVTATPSTVTVSTVTADPDGTTPTNQETRGSSLSALLAPGGQLSSAINQGRNRLASGPPPGLSQTDEPSSAPIPRSAKGPHYYYAEASPDDVQATRQAHNWYFENYNRTNLKPYIGPGKEAFSRRSNSQRAFTNFIVASLTPLLILSTIFRIRII